MSQPAIFALIGESLPQSKRAMGFSMQSIFKRLPIILAPPIGGYMIQIFGIDQGMKIGFVVSIVMAIFAAAVQKKLYLEKERRESSSRTSISYLWKMMSSNLKRLLAADIFARVSSNIISVYVVLYVLNISRRRRFNTAS